MIETVLDSYCNSVHFISPTILKGINWQKVQNIITEFLSAQDYFTSVGLLYPFIITLLANNYFPKIK